MTMYAETLTFLLEQKGIKKADLSRELGMPDQTVRNWFSRDSLPVVDVAMKVAKFFGVSVEYLLTGKDPEFSFEKPEPSKIEKSFSMLTNPQKKAVETVIDTFLSENAGKSETA